VVNIDCWPTFCAYITWKAISMAFWISFTSMVDYYVSRILSLSFSSFNFEITTNSIIVALGHVNTPNLMLKMHFFKRSNTSHNDYWMFFANWNATPIPT
jgi:hypothetical protein